MDQPNRPTLKGYFELLVKVFVAMILLIFWGVGCAVLALFTPFVLSLLLVLAMVGAGAIAFNWFYVFVGMILLLILFELMIE